MRDVRQEYGASPLRQNDLHPDPLEQARRWVDDALREGLPLPNAMTLATCTAEAQPSCRVVLLKGIERGGFTFFTHYDSRKGQEIAENPEVAAVLFWEPLSRQITIAGRAERISVEESSEYFASRPRGSQISAAVSPQSRPVTDEWLRGRVEAIEREYDGRDIPRPAEWGGYRILPREIQFWHGRPNRLHDRFRYRRGDSDSWIIERLAP